MAKFAESAVRLLAGQDAFPLPRVIRTRYPIVLMHGFGVLAGMRRGGHLYAAATFLRMHGVLAFAPNVAPYNTVSFRSSMWADRLADIRDQTGASKVNLIAHSMGGLDARWMIAKRGMHDTIASVTTVSTPHHGTYIADYVLSQPERIREILANLADWVGAHAVAGGEADFRTALSELTLEHVSTAFNPAIENHPDVRYASYAGAAGKGTETPINPILKIGNSILYAAEGPNDGIVSVESAKWGRFEETLEADHAAQVGLSLGINSRFSSNDFYLRLVLELAKDGC
ncbi:MAG: alpha/beta fold hydrolase [Rhodothermales bacterium]|nr:alpha/beta fold hydrolase [Rhodothermales bacterium]